MVLVVLAGCGHGSNSGAASATTTTSGSSWSDAPSAPPDPQTLLHAASTALTKVPGATLIFIQSDTVDVGTWKVRLVKPDGNEQQVKVGSDGYAVLVGPTARNDSAADIAKRRELVSGARLDYEAAVNKALAAVHDGSITVLALQDKNGTTVWTVVVWDTDLVGHELTIDAASGEITANTRI